ncbi:MAG: hypothetical protein J6M95_02515 [Bacilli bacterium]|nr:hypothetical protein [Bacilli bacterium]
MKKFLSLLLVFITGCAPVSKTSSQINYDYEDVGTHISWSDVFNQEDKTYLVYFYSLTCGYCKEIKQEILLFYFSTDEKMYFVETSTEAVFKKGNNLIGMKNIDDFYIFGTPFLIKIINGALSEYYSGIAQILDYINTQ